MVRLPLRCEMNAGVLIVDEIKEHVSIMLRVKKAKCVVEVATIK